MSDAARVWEWLPAEGDRVLLGEGGGRGTVIEVRGRRVHVRYDGHARWDPDGSGWHDPEHLRPEGRVEGGGGAPPER